MRTQNFKGMSEPVQQHGVKTLDVPCPTCGNHEARQVRFARWGGLIGPRLFQLVQCGTCGARFGAANGRPEHDLVARYHVGLLISWVLALAGAVFSFWALA